MQIETMELWLEVADIMSRTGHLLWNFQYDVAAPEGFHAWFWLSGAPEFEVVTHNKEVCEAILKFTPKK